MKIPQIGDLLGGRFAVRRVMQGGQGVVCLVEDIRHRPEQGSGIFVLKFPKLASTLHEAVFRREASIWVSMGRHPSIVPAFWVDVVDGALCVAAEFVAADRMGRTTLRDHMQGGCIPLNTVLRWTYQFLLAMGHARAKGLVAHGDIKPENLLVDSDGDLQVTDFGMAVVVGGSRGIVGGTPAYLAPEQWQGSAATEQSDLYSFGLVLSELCFGSSPLGGLDVRSRNDDRFGLAIPTSHPLRELIGILTSEEPARRGSMRSAKALVQLAAQRDGVRLPEVLAASEHDQREELRAGSNAAAHDGNIANALSLALKLVHRWPEDASGWIQVGRLYLESGQVRAAHDATVRSIRLDPTLSAAWNNLGLVWQDLGDSSKAIDAFREALKCEPENAGAMFNIASSYWQLNEDWRAIDSLRSATTISPGNPAYWIKLAGYLWTLDSNDEATMAWERAIGLVTPERRKELRAELELWADRGEVPWAARPPASEG